MAPVSKVQRSIGRKQFSATFTPLKTATYSGDPKESSLLNTLAWNVTGTLIATGSRDRSIRVWNPDKNIINNTTHLVGHKDTIVKIAFCPTKEGELCSLDRDGTIKFWDVKTKKLSNEVKIPGEANTLAWHPNGEQLIAGNKRNELYVISSNETEPISCHKQTVFTNEVIFDYSGDRFFLTTEAGTVHILSFPECEPAIFQNHDSKAPFVLRGHTTPCISAELQPTGRFLATGGSDSIICLWATDEWICYRTLSEMSGPVKSISFSHDGAFIVGGSDDGPDLKIIHAETGIDVHTIKTMNSIEFVAWHPTRYWLAYLDGIHLRIAGVGQEQMKKDTNDNNNHSNRNSRR